MISKEEIYDLVGVFYQPTYKTFSVNSLDGETFIKPVGVFVSLGLTTSKKVLEDIKNIIVDSGKYVAQLAEISSKRVGSTFLNTIINISNPSQYELTDIGDDTMNEEESIAELNRLKSLMTPEQDLDVLKKYAPKISKLQDLIDKLTRTEGWPCHLIQKKEDDDYSVFHKFVNYKKEGDLEYRLGIYVREKE